MELPPLSNTSARCKGGGRMGTSLQECSEQRTQVDLSYSANGPDMFALVTSILQESKEPEAITDRESLSEPFSPSWTTNLENGSGCSGLFPEKIWDHENQTKVLASQSSYEENLGEEFSTELLSAELSDLQVTDTWPLLCPPCSPLSHEVPEASDPQNKDFSRNDFNPQSSIFPECGNGKKQVDVGRKGRLPSQIWTGFYEEHQQSIATGVLGASDTEKPSSPTSVQASHSVADGLCDLAIQGNRLCAKRRTYASPQFVPLLTSPIQQENITPEGANTKLCQSRQQNCPSNPSTLFNNVKSEDLTYPLRESSNHCLSSRPGFWHQNPSYSGDKCPKSRNVNLSRVFRRTDTQPPVPSSNASVIQPFVPQRPPRKCACLQNFKFPSCKENIKPHHSASCPQVDFQAPRREHLGEISRNVPRQGWPCRPPANRFAKCQRCGHVPDGRPAGQRTGQIEGWAKMHAASVDQYWAKLEALRSKKKMGNLFDFVNPLFLHLGPMASGNSQIQFYPPGFSSLSPPFSAGLPYGSVPHSSRFINVGGDTSVSHQASASYNGPSHTLYLSLEECYRQLRALERERTKLEADLEKSFPGNSFSSSCEIPFFRRPAKPSRVDRLVCIQFQEQARVCTLLGKLEHHSGISIHSSIMATLESHLLAIYTTQDRRNDEVLNTGNSQESYATYEKIVLDLASAVNGLTSSTRKTRTALWCAVQQTVLSKNLTSIPEENALDLDSIPLQAKVLTEGEDKENETMN